MNRPLALACFVSLGLLGCTEKTTSATLSTSGAVAKLAAALGPKPVLLGPPAKLKRGTHVRDARKQAPELFDGDEAREITVPSLPGLKLSVGLGCTTARGCRVAEWVILLPKEHAVAALTRAWGKPAESPGRDGRVLTWWNRADRIRARVEPQDVASTDVSVTLTPYTPLAELLGDGPTLPFENGRPVFGRSYFEVLKEHPEWQSGFSDTSRMELPPTEHDANDCIVELYADEKNLTIGFHIFVEYADAASRAAILGAFERRFGKARKEGETLVSLPPGRKVTIEDDAKNRILELKVEPRR